MTGSSLDSAVFVGTARDCARWLPDVLANLANLSRLYDRTAFIFAVSDATDATATLLRNWLGRERAGKVIDLGALAGRLERRTERIAFARNACLEEVRGSAFAQYGHMVVADMDDVLAAPLDLGSYARAAGWLGAAPDRAAVFASAWPRYYDVWALRHPTWCPHDCWHRIWERPARESFEAAKFREVFARQIALPRGMQPIEVRSAFGGLGLYRMPYALNAGYVGLDVQGREVSEHVAFNEAIGRAGGRLFVFPELQVRAPPQHLYDAGEFGLRWRAAMRLRRAVERYRPAWRTLQQCR
ncbi:hypothetical protein [Reyranella sp.]|uniref:hypothetical protein n=1 Tax=Reyranella sp. TaxID=1929291 RepID=UPI003BAD047C